MTEVADEINAALDPRPAEERHRADVAYERERILVRREALREVDAQQRAGRGPIADRLMDSGALKALPPPEYLIEGFLFRDSLAMLWGRWGLGKSFVAADIALSVANGLSWQHKQVRQGRALYVVAESPAGMGQRVAAWESYRLVRDTGVTWVSGAVNLLDPNEVTELCAALSAGPYVLVVIDTYSRCIPGADENAPGTSSGAVDTLDRIRRASGGACVLLVHHPTKEGRDPRGHGAVFGALDTELELTGSGGTLKLRVTKQKNAPEALPVSFRLKSHEASAVLSDVSGNGPDESILDMSILGRVRDTLGDGWHSKTDLMAALALKDSTFYDRVSPLVNAGLIERRKQGRHTDYRIKDAAG